MPIRPLFSRLRQTMARTPIPVGGTIPPTPRLASCRVRFGRSDAGRRDAGLVQRPIAAVPRLAVSTHHPPEAAAIASRRAGPRRRRDSPAVTPACRVSAPPCPAIRGPPRAALVWCCLLRAGPAIPRMPVASSAPTECTRRNPPRRGRAPLCSLANAPTIPSPLHLAPPKPKTGRASQDAADPPQVGLTERRLPAPAQLNARSHALIPL